MKIKLNDKFESLNPIFDCDKLSDFTIITGKNGSGKTQLLRLLANKDQKKDLVSIEAIPEIRFIQLEGIEVLKNEGVTNDKWLQTINSKLLPLLDFIKKDEILLFLVEEDAYQDLLKSGRENLLSYKEEYYDLLLNRNRNQNYFNLFPEMIKDISTSIELEIIQSKNDFYFNFTEYYSQIPFIQKTAKSVNKKIIDLTIEDLQKTSLNESLIIEGSLFNTQIEESFFGYAKSRNNNRVLYAINIAENQRYDAVSDEEFTKMNTPPWEKINSIFEKYSFNFYVKSIEKDEFHEQFSYKFNLYKKNTIEIIPLEKLSSGEKIILGLILKLFIAERYTNTLHKPDLILLDEPDAHLHPEMCKLLLNVLENTFVKDFGIKVIMTTHSPTTVALAPEDSIYELKNGINSSLKKVTKDYALNLLTEFIPTLSINYKSHRQVFVEAPNDKYYYEKIYNIHFLGKKTTHKLYFVAPEGDKGGCSFVTLIIKKLMKSEVSSAWGIIDWDKKNKPTKNVLVHGDKERYSLENYLYDPLLFVALLIKDNIMNFRTELNLSNSYDSTKFSEESEVELQRFSNHFFCRIYSIQEYNELNDGKTKKVKYFSGQFLDIPEWYLHKQGHKELIPLLETVFNDFFGKYKKNQIEKKLTNIICKDYYPFIPQSTIDLIETLANS